MNKGLGFLIIGIFAIIGGAAFAALLIKNKFSRDKELDFEDFDDFGDFDSAIDDEELKHLFGENDKYDEIENEDAAEDEFKDFR